MEQKRTCFEELLSVREVKVLGVALGGLKRSEVIPS